MPGAADGIPQRVSAQGTSEAIAETRVRELLRELPKNTAGRPNPKIVTSGGHNLLPSIEPVPKQKTKREIIDEIGFTHAQASRFETLAANKEIVEQAKAAQRGRGSPLR